jgi:anti-anti-sigma factor
METRMTNGVLTVGGFAQLTAANNESFGKQMRTALNGHTTIEIDLSRTTFMDCAGLGALTALRKFARGHNGVMRLVNPTPAVQQLFEVVRAEQMFEIVNTRATDLPKDASHPAFSDRTTAGTLLPSG